MPGDGNGDMVHNFFAQDNLSQAQHQSRVLEGNWPINSHVWANGQRQIDVLNSSSTNFPIQNSDINTGQTSFPVNATNGLNFSQADPGPDFSKTQSRNVQPYSNGFMYGNQIYLSKQNGADFLAVNTDSNQHQVTSRGFPIHEQPVRGPERQTKVSNRSETPLPSVSFDLFGGQQQMNHQQVSMMQAFQRQQSGLSDMQQLQQVAVQKIQDLQRQQQLQLLDSRPQNMINQDSLYTKHLSSYQSSPFNGTQNSDVSHYPGAFDPGTNWMNRGSSAMQGSPGGDVFPPNAGQTQHLMNLGPQQVDQSLYGVPVSSSRGLALRQYPHMGADGSSIPQMLPSSISHRSNQHNILPNQISLQEGTCISSQKFQTENMLGHASSQLVNSGMMDMSPHQQINSMQSNAPQQELDTQSETLHERPAKSATLCQNDVALDPTEEKILYGSENNLWAAFGNDRNVSGEAGNLFDDGGLPSINSGSWSALMQSAVAETSSSDMGPQESGGMTFHNTDGSPLTMTPLMRGDNVKQAYLDCNLKIPSALNSGSTPPSNEIKTHFMEYNQFGHKLQTESTQRVATDLSHRSGQSLGEAINWSTHSLLQKPIAEGSKRVRNGSPHALDAERDANAISTIQTSGQGGTMGQLGRNSLAAVPSDRDRDKAPSSHENEELQSCQDNQYMSIQGEVVPRSTLWKSNSPNYQENKGVLSLNNATASVENSYNMGVGRETSSLVPNNYFLNQWKDAHPPTKFQGSENSGRILEQVNDYNQGLDSINRSSRDGVTRHDENHLMKNSIDSHISNLSQHVSGGLREIRLSDKSDSRFLASGKQKLNDQVFKSSVSRKFQYHPMGNLDDDGEPRYCPLQLSQDELPKDSKGAREQPSTGSFPGYGPSSSVSFRKPFDSHTSNKASSTSQNMLELLHKVDESRDQGGTMHLRSESNLSSQPLVTDSADESAGCLQHIQSSAVQGFGLQLAPPSQRLQTSDLLSSSLNGQSLIGSMHTDHAGAQMGGKGLPRVPMSSTQSLPFPIVESQNKFKDETYAMTGHHGNENSVCKMPENYKNFSSDALRAKNQLQEQQITMVNEKLASNRHLDSFSGNNFLFMKRESAETVPFDASHQIQEDNLAFSGGMEDVRSRGLPTTFYIKNQLSGSQHMISQSASSQVLHNMRGTINEPQPVLASQFLKVPSHFSELSQPNTIAESNSSGDLDTGKRHDFCSKLGAICANSTCDEEEEHKQKESSGQMVPGNNDSDSITDATPESVPSVKNHVHDSPVNFGTAQKDIEAFGRSLKPNSFLNQRYDSLDQIRESMDMDAESDLNSRVSKRMKGPDNGVDSRINLMEIQKNENIVDNSLCSNFVVPSEDSRNMRFSTPSDISQRNPPPCGNVASREIVPLGLDASENHPSTNNTSSIRIEHPMVVNPQMAPSWFNQYGNFKNGQTLPLYNTYNTQQEVALRSVDSLNAVGKSSGVLDSHRAQDKSTTASIDECQASGKKRKAAASELYPWHKEIYDGSQNLLSLGVAEAVWSKAINCLPAKVADNAESIEEGHPVFRATRRLNLTTQLMQSLFHPPPATIPSVDAGLNYENVIYAVSRLELGDTCSSVYLSKGVGLPPDDVDLHSTKVKRRGDLCFANATAGFLEKARKLENDFSRLDKSSSILDVRMECSDLEKFSVINRFAKFHGPRQADNAETASTSTPATTQKPSAQRYVTALPMPKCLPDSVQCLSL